MVCVMLIGGAVASVASAVLDGGAGGGVAGGPWKEQKVGVRGRRGPDWKWGDQDKDRKGMGN